MVASISHGGTLGDIADYYFLGFKDIMTFLILSLSTYFGARILTIRMAEFIGDFSTAESMGKLYVPVIRKITATTVALVMLGLVVAQLKAILGIMHFTLYNMPEELTYWLTSATGFVVILYSTFGGARSIAMTDVFQFLCFGCTFPLIAFLLLRCSKISIAEGWARFKQLSQFVDCSDIFSRESVEEYYFCATS